MPDRTLPNIIPMGFVRYAGIPNTSESKSYFASVAEAIKRCQKDTRCVGLSNQRLFYGTLGFPTIVPGRLDENECFMRASNAE